MNNHWDELISALQCLPNVGKRSAQRIAFHLLANKRQHSKKLADCLNDALANLGNCRLCNNFSPEEICNVCSNPKRNNSKLCIVESPMDLIAIEQTHKFDGLYYVLMGVLSPIDGTTPTSIGFSKLEKRIVNAQTKIDEIILATNFTNEGETTAYVLSELIANHKIKLTRLAHGVPVGGEIEYLDLGTIARALIDRQKY